MQNVVRGYNACCFAYGQSGSGKTHTMTGPPAVRSRPDSATSSGTATTSSTGRRASRQPPPRAGEATPAAALPAEESSADAAGLAPRVFRDLFEVIEAREGEVSVDVQYTCRCSYLQIYNEQVRSPHTGAESVSCPSSRHTAAHGPRDAPTCGCTLFGAQQPPMHVSVPCCTATDESPSVA